jgi:hypothetical protein
MSQIDVVASDALLAASLIQAVPPKIAQALLGFGRSKLYEELGKGNLDAVKDGARTLITVESIRRRQASLPRATFKPPKPPRMEDLDRLHAKQRAERRADRRSSRRRGE